MRQPSGGWGVGGGGDTGMPQQSVASLIPQILSYACATAREIYRGIHDISTTRLSPSKCIQFNMKIASADILSKEMFNAVIITTSASDGSSPGVSTGLWMVQGVLA